MYFQLHKEIKTILKLLRVYISTPICRPAECRSSAKQSMQHYLWHSSPEHIKATLMSLFKWIASTVELSLHHIKWCWWVMIIISSNYYIDFCCSAKISAKERKAKKKSAPHLMHQGVAGLLRQVDESSNIFVHSKVWSKTYSSPLAGKKLWWTALKILFLVDLNRLNQLPKGCMVWRMKTHFRTQCTLLIILKAK